MANKSSTDNDQLLPITNKEVMINGQSFYMDPDKDNTLKKSLSNGIKEIASENIDNPGINLYSASSLGDIGSSDATSSYANNNIIYGSASIGTSGNNRILILAVSYFGVSGGVASCTFNDINMHQIISQQININKKIAGVELYYLLDNEIMWKSTSYPWRVAVDGSDSTVYASPIYLENVKQEAPSNSVIYTGNNDNIIVNPISPDTSGSVRIDVLFTDDINDDPVPGDNQVILAGGGSKLNGVNEGNTHTMCTSIKYLKDTKNNVMSWSNMSSESNKILVSLEMLPEIAMNTAGCFFIG